jgi:hypothetical protein
VKRKRRQGRRKAPLRVSAILEWADVHHQRTGKWPEVLSGRIADSPTDDTWNAVHQALKKGLRGMPGNETLAHFLYRHRGVAKVRYASELRIEDILKWADAHFARTGTWPISRSGMIANSGGERWSGVHSALENGHRGLPGGDSLARLLSRYRGVHHHLEQPPLSFKQVLQWADGYFRREGKWPSQLSGPVLEEPSETWGGINQSFCVGLRGLPGATSLSKFLAAHRNKRDHVDWPLGERQILDWARAHLRRTGKWPTMRDGQILEAKSEAWSRIEYAFRHARRGLPKTTLYQFLLANGLVHPSAG